MRIDSYTGAPEGESGIDPYLYSRSIRGVPSNHGRTYRGTENCFEVHHGKTSDGKTIAKRIGYHTIGGPVTVTYADGTTVEKDPAEFRRARAASKRAAREQNQAQAHRILASDPRFGNHSELASGDC